MRYLDHDEHAKVSAAVAAAEASCGNAAETAAAGVLLLNAVRVSALGQDFAEAYAGLETFPAKSSKAYANAVIALGKYLVGEGLLEEGRSYRDRLLTALHDEHPQYGFDGHKGYSTPEHLAALREHGACKHHRRSFAPVREAMERQLF